MSINLKVTKFTAIVSGISFLATFAICLNISYGCFDLKWLSNEFLLIIFGGVFTSTLVVLICEIHKYFLNKTQAENEMYNCCTELLARFLSVKAILTELVNDKNKLTTEGLLKSSCQHINHQMNAYFCIDYTTCSKKQTLYSARKGFNNFLIDTGQKTLNDCVYFDIAIIKSKIKNVENGMPEHSVSTQNDLLLKVANALISEFNVCIENITVFLENIDYSGRFQFRERFFNVVKGQKNYTQESLEEFLNRTCH